jgi:hypothetical protein
MNISIESAPHDDTLKSTLGVTAITIARVAIITALTELKRAVATDRGRRGAWTAREVEDILPIIAAELYLLAVIDAAIIIARVAVITELVRLKITISTRRELTGVGAAVEVARVPVVTSLNARLRDPIPTASGLTVVETGVLIDAVPVITALAPIDHAISAIREATARAADPAGDPCPRFKVAVELAGVTLFSEVEEAIPTEALGLADHLNAQLIAGRDRPARLDVELELGPDLGAHLEGSAALWR